MLNRSDKEFRRLLRDHRCTDRRRLKALAEGRDDRELGNLAELIDQPGMDVLDLSLSPMRMAAVI